MTKKAVLLFCAALVLASLYVANFTDWLKPKKIHIFWRISPANAANISFYLDKGYELTSVEVFSAEDARTNKFPHALWHMIAAGTPPVTTNFMYGEAIPGMKPDVATALPEPLQPGTDYCLVVQTRDKLKAESSFSLH